MKSLLLHALLAALFTSPAWAQNADFLTFAALPIDSTTHLVTYTGVVAVADAPKEQLLLRARAWAARSFRDSKRAPQMADEAAGTYSSRGVVRLPDGAIYSMVLTVQATNGSYRYIINQLHYTYELSLSGAISGRTDESAEHWATYRSINAYYVNVRVHEVRQFIPQLLASLQATMSTTGAPN